MIDSHCHLNHEDFSDDFEKVLHEAHSEGIKRIVIVGYDLESSRKAIEIKKQFAGREGYPSLSASVGFAPQVGKEWNAQNAQAIYSLAQDPLVDAIGEIGLDYFHLFGTKEEQHRLFHEMLEMAQDLKKPVIFHLREAEDDFFRILDEAKFDQPAVLHCFTGSEKAMQMGVERGFFVSFSGIITFPKAGTLRQVAVKTPSHHLLVETDAPYLAPHPYRGKRCLPTHVFTNAKVLSDLKNIPLAEMSALVDENMGRFISDNH